MAGGKKGTSPSFSAKLIIGCAPFGIEEATLNDVLPRGRTSLQKGAANDPALATGIAIKLLTPTGGRQNVITRVSATKIRYPYMSIYLWSTVACCRRCGSPVRSPRARR